MGPKKKTPIKQTKRPRGRPRKNRPKLDVSGRRGQSVSHLDRMKIVLLAEAGRTPSEIVEMVGCDWNTAVPALFALDG